ncbi:MAG: hypothetical protein HYY84_15030 [Deltaproteobacteria bacterium]|nr:hypothetical protein [Deltaproteobacteria bacterium]
MTAEDHALRVAAFAFIGDADRARLLRFLPSERRVVLGGTYDRIAATNELERVARAAFAPRVNGEILARVLGADVTGRAIAPAVARWAVLWGGDGE